MHGIEEGLLDKGCAEASDLLYIEAKVKDFSVNKTFNKPYLGVGVSLMYKQLFATLATDATKLDSDVVFVESRLTLGYRF